MTRTPSQTVGPFFAIGLCRRPDDELDPGGVELRGRLLDGRGDPVPDGVVEVWDPEGRRWGRCGTGPDGGFSFRVPRQATRLEAHVFARGLLRHQRTRIYLRDDAADEVLNGLTPAERATLVARRDGDRLLFDIRLQGERATVFFEH
jgi:protocatechuate 3,4-dioxygenase alpha subunit